MSIMIQTVVQKHNFRNRTALHLDLAWYFDREECLSRFFTYE